MRCSTKEITDTEKVVRLLKTCAVGRLGTVGKDGYPMVKPLNFVHADRAIYFHSAQEGEKIEDIMRDNRVCFEADLPIAMVKSRTSPCRAEYLYQSVIVKGRATIIHDEKEKLQALSLLMAKYQPEGGYGEFPAEKLRITGVVRIDIEEMTGKEDLGDESLKKKAEKALEEGVPLPIVLYRDEPS